MYVHNRVSKSTLKELSQPNQQLEGTMKSIPPAEPEDLSSAVEESLFVEILHWVKLQS